MTPVLNSSNKKASVYLNRGSFFSLVHLLYDILDVLYQLIRTIKYLHRIFISVFLLFQISLAQNIIYNTIFIIFILSILSLVFIYPVFISLNTIRTRGSF